MRQNGPLCGKKQAAFGKVKLPLAVAAPARTGGAAHSKNIVAGVSFALFASGCTIPVDSTEMDGLGGAAGDSDSYVDTGTGGSAPGSGGTAGTGTGGRIDATGGTAAGGSGGSTNPGGSGGGSGTGGGPSAPTGCEGLKEVKPGYLQGETCVPACKSSSGGDWGYENGTSCIVAGSSTANMSGSCELDGVTIVMDQCPPAGSFSCPGAAKCGCQENVPGLASNKLALWQAGGSQDPYMFAAAMMETDNMSADYTYGDGKSNDAFNAGICKQNWGMIRSCHPAWNSLEDWQYSTSSAMNTDRALDVQVFLECRAYYEDDWWTYHRQGLGYTKGSDAYREEDIQRFKDAMDWTYCMLEGHYSDGVRFWVDVNAI